MEELLRIQMYIFWLEAKYAKEKLPLKKTMIMLEKIRCENILEKEIL